MNVRELMRLSPVIPVLTVTRVEDAVPLAQALVRGGIRVLEVTLRTSCALDAITEMRELVPGAVVGAGTLPDAPDIRPSVTSATLKPRFCSTPSGGVSECSSGMPFARGPWKRTTTTASRSSSPALNAAHTCS